MGPWGVAHGFIDLSELFELGAQRLIVGVPCEATIGERSECDDSGVRVRMRRAMAPTR